MFFIARLGHILEKPSIEHVVLRLSASSERLDVFVKTSDDTAATWIFLDPDDVPGIPAQTYRLAVISGGRSLSIGGRAIQEDVHFDICRRWIRHCGKEHGKCPILADMDLPTRLIDVGSSREPGSLELMTPLKGSKGQYVALSHCWGQGKRPVTTRKNVAKRHIKIHFEKLPATFQDAIVATRALGYRYLWIDSLCILQDDRVEWHNECPKMTSTYSNAAVTIAGPAAKDSHSGFLWPRHLDASGHNIRFKTCQDDLCSLKIVPLEDEDDGTLHFEWASVLATRAWVLQERLMSPRVLYFGSEQMYFECCTATFCEGFTPHRPGIVMDNQGVPKEVLSLTGTDFVDSWYDVVTDYSSRRLTYGDDTLHAISGLANLYQPRLEDEYFLGLWKRELVRGMHWERAHGPVSRRSAKAPRANLPSWTWASCDFAIDYSLWGAGLEPQVEIVASGPGDRIDQAESALLVVRGRLKIAHINIDPFLNDMKAKISDPISGIQLATGTLDKPLFPDSLVERMGIPGPVLNSSVACLCISKTVCKDGEFQRILLLEAVDHDLELPSYRRIGIVGTSWVDVKDRQVTGWFLHTDPMTIRLV